jgi:hypothetical protein
LTFALFGRRVFLNLAKVEAVIIWRYHFGSAFADEIYWLLSIQRDPAVDHISMLQENYELLVEIVFLFS